jgi:hypothetical protein
VRQVPQRAAVEAASALVIAALSTVSAVMLAQAPTRIATTAQALITSPVFFHGKQIVVRQPFETVRDVTRLVIPRPGARTTRAVFVLWRERPSVSEGEIRGEFWDLGRLQEGDARFASYDFRSILEVATEGRWPPRDQLFVITGATLVESPLPPTPTLRAIALAPERYADRGVTVAGRFKGRNLYGDLPQPLNTPQAKARWDFVLQSADAAVWVTGLRPRGKDFDLDPAARVDTGRWLEVTGIVRHEGPAVWIEAQSLALSTPPTETPVEITIAPTPKEAPPQVIFSAPGAEETDVERGAPVRIQFSRDMAARTFEGRVRVSYAGPTPGGSPPPPVPRVAVTYNDGNRSIEIKFAQPLDRFHTVKVELLDGITATDGQPLQPWSMTFTTGS